MYVCEHYHLPSARIENLPPLLKALFYLRHDRFEERFHVATYSSGDVANCNERYGKTFGFRGREETFALCSNEP